MHTRFVLQETKVVKEMDMAVLILLIIIIPLSSQSPEKQLLDHLLKDYSPRARPVLNISKPVVVTFGFELNHIAAIVESEQTIEIKVWLRLSWINEFMKWDPSDFGNITISRLTFGSVWTPDIFPQEEMGSDMSAGPSRYKTRIRISPDGLHKWFIPALLKSSCRFEVSAFPFDFQSCMLKFTSWTHDQGEIDLKEDLSPILTKNYVTSSEWDVINVTRKVITTKYACCPNRFVDIEFTINLKRKPLYYIYYVVAPCIIQMFIILFTFCLPPQSGERVGVLITVLLVFAVYLQVLSDALPKTSKDTPALSRFYITAMAESACSIIATCFVLAIYFKGSENGVYPIPRWTRRLFIDWIGKYMCVRKNLGGPSKGAAETKATDESLTEEHKMEETEMLKEPTMRTAVNEIRVITAPIHDMDNPDIVKEEWELLANVFDRLFLVAFLLIFVISSLAILVPLILTDSKVTLTY